MQVDVWVRRRFATDLGVVGFRWLCAVLVMAVSVSEQASSGPLAEVQADPDTRAKVESFPDLDEVIRRVSEQQKALKTLRATFQQTKKTPVLLAEERSAGEFFFRAPDAVRWDYAEPDPMVVLIQQGVVLTYLPDLGTLTRSKASKRQQRLLGMFAGSQQIDEFYDQFQSTLTDAGAPSPFLITLRPKGSGLRRRVTMIEVYVDRDLYLPVKVVYHEKKGAITSFELNDIEVDLVIHEDYFNPNFDDPVLMESPDGSAGGG